MRRSFKSRRTRTSKYGAIKTEVDGIVFASHAEARRYSELKLLEKAGEITNLVLQPKFPIVVNGVKICTFIGDFGYWDVAAQKNITEDVKGAHKGSAYAMFNIKKKLVLACYGIEILET